MLNRTRTHTIGLWRRALTAAVFLAAVASPALAQQRVRLGIEVLLSDSMHLVRGKRVGLITNHTGVVPDGRSTIDLLHRANGVRLTALFAPEHGLRGQADAGERIQSSVVAFENEKSVWYLSRPRLNAGSPMIEHTMFTNSGALE